MTDNYRCRTGLKGLKAQGTSAPQEVPAAGGEQVPMDGPQAGSQESYEDLSNFAESLLEKG